MKLTNAEKQAFEVLKLLISPRSFLGISLKDLDPTPANIQQFLKEVQEMFEDNPREALEICGFFDCPKFLKR